MDAGAHTQTYWEATKDFLAPVAGIVGVILGGSFQHLTAKAKIKADERVEERKLSLDNHKELLLAEVARDSALTTRFTALFDAYQEHVDMLRMEITALRDEVHSLRSELANRLKICAGCDKFASNSASILELARSLEPKSGTGA